MNDLQIRDAKKEDIPMILGLLYELGRPKPKDQKDKIIFEKKIKQYFSDSDKQIIAALLNFELVGFLSMIFLPRLNQIQPELYVPELIIREGYRNRGIGQKLINSCIEIGKKKKCHRIRLESGNLRKESHQFYKNLGFEQSALSFTKDL